jgi:hypothetical protein
MIERRPFQVPEADYRAFGYEPAYENYRGKRIILLLSATNSAEAILPLNVQATRFPPVVMASLTLWMQSLRLWNAASLAPLRLREVS